MFPALLRKSPAPQGTVRIALTWRAVRAECGLAGDQRGAGDIPERAGSAVAQHHFVAIGNLEEFGQSFAD